MSDLSGKIVTGASRGLGRDIMAACGQLKSESVKQRASERMAQLRSQELARMPS